MALTISAPVGRSIDHWRESPVEASHRSQNVSVADYPRVELSLADFHKLVAALVKELGRHRVVKVEEATWRQHNDSRRGDGRISFSCIMGFKETELINAIDDAMRAVVFISR